LQKVCTNSMEQWGLGLGIWFNRVFLLLQCKTVSKIMRVITTFLAVKNAMQFYKISIAICRASNP
jgi:hypothetical protein